MITYFLNKFPKLNLAINILLCGFSISFCIVMFWYFLIPNSDQSSDILDDLKKIILYIIYLWIFFSMVCFVISQHIFNFNKFCQFFYNLVPHFILIAFVVLLFFAVSSIFVTISTAYIFALFLAQIYIVFIIKKILKNLK